MEGLTSRWRFATERSMGSGMPLVSRLLAARGLSDPAAASHFLSPKLTHLHDPSLVPDLERAARRVLDALEADETIAIYGDYDVDGITATAILYHTLRSLRPAFPPERLITYVPHRIDEGYGLNSEAISELAGRGAKVIISVDCGITAVDPAERARAEGVDLIITDHHNPPAAGDAIPDAFAVVHPRLPGSRYPFADLPGAGVAYKLAWRMCAMHCGTDRVRADLRGLLVNLLAFAALGVIADVVPLSGENRVIAHFGLPRIRHAPFVGLRALVEASGLAGESVGEYDVGFKLGPRLNASGRLGHAREAVELFTTADSARAAEIAEQLTTQNEERRRVERDIFEHACRLAEQSGMTAPGRRAIVLAHEDWHPGVVGIVCSRLVGKYSRPAILMQRREGACHGSGRSIDGYNLHAGLSACSGLLTKFGGHDMAAGLALAEVKLPAFTDALIGHANELISEEMLRPAIDIDCEAGFEELTLEAVRSIASLAPFGRGNPEPAILIRHVVLAFPPRVLGKEARHLALTLRPALATTGAGRATPLLRTLAWNWGEHLDRLRPGSVMDVVLTPRVSTFSGRPSVEPEIRDVSIHGNAS